MHNLQLFCNKKMLLQVVGNSPNTEDWAQLNQADIKSVLNSKGALLIRGLEIPDSEVFGKVLSILFGGPLAEYTYRSTPRTQIQKNIYTATEYHPSETIPQHNEIAYSNAWPLRIGFLCTQPAASGGNTPISDSRVAYSEIPIEIREEFEKKQVTYVRNYSKIDLPWSEVFQTNDKLEVERYCRANRIEFEWTDTGLRTKQTNPAVAKHPVSGEKLWFNQAHLFHISSLDRELQEGLIALLGEENLPRNAYFGDGTSIDEDALQIIRNTYERTKFAFDWHKNDLLLLDNMLYTHGREPFTGKRTVLVGMGQTVSLS